MRYYQTPAPIRLQHYKNSKPSTCVKHGKHMDWTLDQVNRKTPRTRCRICEAERRKNSDANKNPETLKIRVCKKNAKVRGIPFELVETDLTKLFEKQGGACALSGQAFNSLRDISIDRIDSQLGYSPTNIQLVTKAINVAKHVLSNSTFIQMCGHVINHQGKPKTC